MSLDSSAVAAVVAAARTVVHEEAHLDDEIAETPPPLASDDESGTDSRDDSSDSDSTGASTGTPNHDADKYLLTTLHKEMEATYGEGEAHTRNRLKAVARKAREHPALKAENTALKKQLRTLQKVTAAHDATQDTAQATSTTQKKLLQQTVRRKVRAVAKAKEENVKLQETFSTEEYRKKVILTR